MIPPCESCGLPLQPGSTHATERACILALRYVVEQGRICQECGQPIDQHYHPSCVPDALARGAAGMGVRAAKKKIAKGLEQLFFGGSPIDPPDPSADRHGNRGDQFEP